MIQVEASVRSFCDVMNQIETCKLPKEVIYIISVHISLAKSTCMGRQQKELTHDGMRW